MQIPLQRPTIRISVRIKSWTEAYILNRMERICVMYIIIRVNMRVSIKYSKPVSEVILSVDGRGVLTSLKRQNYRSAHRSLDPFQGHHLRFIQKWRY
jgi:hypothetical protein